jgi:hypothetical protein
MITYLEISSWGPYSFGASHFYGNLVFSDGDTINKIEVEHALTKLEAESLNQKDTSEGCYYKEGDLTQRWDFKVDLRKAAIKLWKKLGIGGVLVEGLHTYCDPQLILAGPSKIVRDGNKLYREYKTLEYEDHKERVKELWDEWDKLFE